MGPVPTLPLAELRTRLQQRERALREALMLARHDPRPDRADVQDRKDLAERTAADDLAEAEDLRERQELLDVASALRRLDDQHYGACEDCGAPIGALRLLAQPAARRCLDCQGAHERRLAAAA